MDTIRDAKTLAGMTVNEKRIYDSYPLPKGYDNKETIIKIFYSNQEFCYDFLIIAANENLKPLKFNILEKKWEELDI